MFKEFDEYVGRHLKQRHKDIGLRYAKRHGYPELIGKRAYGIDFKNGQQDSRLMFHVLFDSEAVVDKRGRPVPFKSIKTVTEVILEDWNCTPEEIAEAERIGRGYLQLALEPEDLRLF